MDKEQYQDWKNHPLTKKYLQFLQDKRQELMEDWAEGKYSLQTTEQSALKTSEAMGRAQCLQDLVELEDDYIGNFYRQQTKGNQDVHED